MKAVALIALVAAVTTCTCSIDQANASQLRAGDTLVYAITLELQQHTVQTASKNQVTSEASGQGDETLHIYRVGSDGTALARVNAHFQGTQDGQPINLQGAFFGKVLPNGEVRIQGGLNRSIDEALNFANQITREAVGHALTIGRSWTTVENTPYLSLSIVRRVVGRQVYQRFPAYVIESTADGTLKRTTEGKPTSGSVSIAGTSYYDEADKLLIGESLRMLTVVQPSAAQAHVNYSAIVNLVLSSLSHAASAASARATAPAPAPTATPTPAPSLPATPGPLPGGYGATPAPTVTPRGF